MYPHNYSEMSAFKVKLRVIKLDSCDFNKEYTEYGSYFTQPSNYHRSPPVAYPVPYIPPSTEAWNHHATPDEKIREVEHSSLASWMKDSESFVRGWQINRSRPKFFETEQVEISPVVTS